VLPQLGTNLFKGTCDVGTLGDLAGLSAASVVDFTASGLSGTVPANWSTGAWASTLSQLTLAQNPEITGAVLDLSGCAFQSPSLAKFVLIGLGVCL